MSAATPSASARRAAGLADIRRCPRCFGPVAPGSAPLLLDLRAEQAAMSCSAGDGRGGYCAAERAEGSIFCAEHAAIHADIAARWTRPSKTPKVRPAPVVTRHVEPARVCGDLRCKRPAEDGPYCREHASCSNPGCPEPREPGRTICRACLNRARRAA